MKTQKAILDSMFTKLDNDLAAKAMSRKNLKTKYSMSKDDKKNIKKIESNSNVPTETYISKPRISKSERKEMSNEKNSKI